MITIAHEIAGAILRELSYPNSSWNNEFPTPAHLAELFAAHPGTINRALAMLGEQHLLVQRSTRTPSGNLSRIRRWQPPHIDAPYSAVELALKLSHAILNGGLREIPGARSLAALYRTDLDTVDEAMDMLCTRFLVTPVDEHPTDAPIGWIVNTDHGLRPGTIASPDIHTVVHELSRRIVTGWYRYTALDGTWQSRPFPTPAQICAQLHCAPTVALTALRHLALAGLIATPTNPEATTLEPDTSPAVAPQPTAPPRRRVRGALTRRYALPKPNAVLHGGNSAILPETDRYIRVDNPTQPLKILTGNGYDHFLPTTKKHQHLGLTLQVFTWSHRTYIAE